MPLQRPGKYPTSSDVFFSRNVFINGVEVALYMAPGTGPGGGSQSPTEPSPGLTAAETQRDPEVVVSADMEAAAVDSAPVIAADPANLATIASGPMAGLTAKITGGMIPPAGFIPTDLADFADFPDLGEIAITMSPFNLDPSTAFSGMDDMLSGFTSDLSSWTQAADNLNIKACMEEMGYMSIQDLSADVPWSAAFVGTVLKKSGMPYLSNNLSGLAYATEWSKQAIAANTADPSTWRLNDVITFDMGDGNGHTGFIRAVDASGSRVTVLAGNQADGLNEMTFEGDMWDRIAFVGRGAALPAELDVPPPEVI